MKKALFGLVMMVVCGSAFAQVKKPVTQDYWVYVRLEDRSGVTPSDDVGRSKAGDVIAVLPVTPQHVPSETEKKEWMIYKTSLTETERQGLLETWEETYVKTETFEIEKETWENAEKKQEFLTEMRVVSVLSETAKQATEYAPVKKEDLSKYSPEELNLIGLVGGVPVVKNLYSVEVRHEYQKPIAYRKNKLDVSKLGVPVKKGLIAEKIDASKIQTQVKTSEDFARYELKRKFYAYVQRPLKIVSNKIIGVAHAETVSTINKTGENYNTLTLWEDAVDGDLVTATSQPTAECYNDDGDLDDRLVIDGSTTNSSYYMKVTVPEGDRHNGIAGNGFVLRYTSSSVPNYSGVIVISDPNVIIEWLEITGWSGPDYSQGTNGISIRYDNPTIIRFCLIHDPVQLLRRSYRAIGKPGDDSNDATDIYGNIIYNIVSSTYIGSCIGSKQAEIYNNTVYNCTGVDGATMKGIATGTAGYIKNNIVIDADTDFSFGASTTHDYNASSDLTATGTNSITGITTSIFESVTAGSEDFHLVSGASVIDAGVDLGSPYDYDIDGDERTGTWDIGADEYVRKPFIIGIY